MKYERVERSVSQLWKINYKRERDVKFAWADLISKQSSGSSGAFRLFYSLLSQVDERFWASDGFFFGHTSVAIWTRSLTQLMVLFLFVLFYFIFCCDRVLRRISGFDVRFGSAFLAFVGCKIGVLWALILSLLRLICIKMLFSGSAWRLLTC